MTYYSVGAGGVNHLAMAGFDKINSLEMVHVPYKGLAQALQDIAGGRVDTGFAVIGGAVPLLQGGKLKALAVAGKNRSVLAPDVPTFAEVRIFRVRRLVLLRGRRAERHAGGCGEPVCPGCERHPEQPGIQVQAGGPLGLRTGGPKHPSSSLRSWSTTASWRRRR